MRRLIILLTALLMILTVTATAEILVQDGVVTGLDKNSVYQYARVNLTNYEDPDVEIVPEGSTTIKGLDVGLYYLYNATKNIMQVVWIPGSADDRSQIGEVAYSDYARKEVLKTQNENVFIQGVWTGMGATIHSTFDKYYISAVGSEHLSTGDANAIKNGTASIEQIRNKAQNIVYKYAYADDEILPVTDLASMGFRISRRQHSIMFSYDSTAPDTELKTKYVLYTMNEQGELETHTAYFTTAYTYMGTRHGISVSMAFPDATGYILGLEIYPYGDIPLEGLRLGVESGSIIATIFAIEYLPDGYVAADKAKVTSFPAKYNGNYVSYATGYGNGIFNPDGDITRAEAANLIAKALLNSKTAYTGKTASFLDCNSGDWYHDAVAFLESLGAYSFIDSPKFNPNEIITRGEFLQTIFNVSEANAAEYCDFTDVTADMPYYTAVCTFSKLGIVNGYADGTFRPNSRITRAEVITIINRLVNLTANENTVDRSSLVSTFKDIDGHWAEYEILMATNDNVKSYHHTVADTSGILETDNTIQIETNHFRVKINKKNGKVASIVNLANNSEISAASLSPWFTYLTEDNKISFYPTSLDIVDNRLCATYSNGMKAYFIIEVFDDYFTVELDSDLPLGAYSIHFANLRVNTAFDEYDEESYRLSGVSMNVNTTSEFFPGGKSLAANAFVLNKFDAIGAKVGVVFSRFGGRVEGEHRAILKEIVASSDPAVAIINTKGGAFSEDHADTKGDYVILDNGLSASTAYNTAQVMKKYSLDQLDMHQGGGTFIQGEFNFKCAAVSGEAFTTASQFKERIGNTLIGEGIQLGLHTYSSLVPSNATTILSNPKWQQQIAYDKDNELTLASDISSSAKLLPSVEDTSGLTVPTSSIPWNGKPATMFYLIDEEIVYATSFGSGGINVTYRGMCGTKAVAHKAGAKIRQLQGWYGMFQPVPGSELFYHIADLTAKAYNEGGFEMIYLDGLESFARDYFCESDEQWYYYATFIQRVISGCEKDPIIEGSMFPVAFATSRTRGGAWDYSHRAYKTVNSSHLMNNKTLLGYYCGATLGWFHYSTDMQEAYKNTTVKTLFRDDFDHMGSIGIAYDMTTVIFPFSTEKFNTYKSLNDNAMYYSLYSKLRKAGYFSPKVKDTLRKGIDSGKEYKVEEQPDGTWAFREMTYFKNRVFNAAQGYFVTGKGTNTYSAQTPYVRIEQRYSTLGNNSQVLYDFDENAQVISGHWSTVATGGSTRLAYKISVYGNGSATDGIMVALNNCYNFAIPCNFTGWREFILIDADNADHSYAFSGENQMLRGEVPKDISSVRVMLSGNCTGVRLGDLVACEAVNSPAQFPSVTVGGKTLTFNTNLRSGEYIEYFPELNRAYKHYYDVNADGTNGNEKYVTEISFSGSLTVPHGDFTYTYNGSATSNAPLRAQVVIGVKSDEIIANEDGWINPYVDLDEDIQYITLK